MSDLFLFFSFLAFKREMRQLISQLRQENQELKHQLRQYSSRSKTQNKSSVPSSPLETSGFNAPDANLTHHNQKLKKQVDELKKQLHDLSFQLEKVKVDSAKEVAKWQQKIGVKSSPSPSTRGTKIPNSHEKDSTDSLVIIDLKKRLVTLERELRLERLSKGVPTRSSPQSSRTASPSTRRANSASLSTRESSRRSARSSSPQIKSQNRQATKPPLPHATENYRHPSPKSRSLDHYEREKDSSSARALRDSNFHPSSSLGRRFDPTAYQDMKAKRKENQIRTPPRRFDSPDSGYSSANSQSSRNSNRSRISDSSRSSKNGKKKSKSSKTSRGPEENHVKKNIASEFGKSISSKFGERAKEPAPESGFGREERPQKKEGGGGLINQISKSLDKARSIHERNENSVNYGEEERSLSRRTLDAEIRGGKRSITNHMGLKESKGSGTGNRFRDSNLTEPKDTKHDSLMDSWDTTTSLTTQIFRKHPEKSSEPNAKQDSDSVQEIEEFGTNVNNDELNKRINAISSYLDNLR
jgi:hypothetical protein